MRTQALPRDGFRVPHQLGERARCHDFAPVHTRTRAQVDDVIRAPHGGFVVFDHEHGVAARLELFKRLQQLLIIARVEADCGFVQDV